MLRREWGICTLDHLQKVNQLLTMPKLSFNQLIAYASNSGGFRFWWGEEGVLRSQWGILARCLTTCKF